MAAVNPFMMDDTPAANPFGGSAASINPFLSANPASSSTAAASNPFLMDTPSNDVTVSANAYNPFAAVSAPGANDGLDWLTSGGAMQTQDIASPYDIPDASAAPLDHNEELFLEHDDHLDASLEPLDDLLDVELPLPPEDLSLDLPTNEHLDAPLIEATAPATEVTVPSPSKGRPPPPPRPPTRPSPPHETQQLILSVTGAMQVIHFYVQHAALLKYLYIFFYQIHANLLPGQRNFAINFLTHICFSPFFYWSLFFN